MTKLFVFLRGTVGAFNMLGVIILGMFVALLESIGMIALFTKTITDLPGMGSSVNSLVILIMGISMQLMLKIYMEKLTWKNNALIAAKLLRHSTVVTKLHQDPSIIAKDTLAESQNIAVNVLYPSLNIFSRISYLLIFIIILIVSGVLNKSIVLLAATALIIFVIFAVASKSLSSARSEFLSKRYLTALNIILARREIIQSRYEKPYLEFKTAIRGFSQTLLRFRMLQYGLKPALELMFLLVALLIVTKNDFSLSQVTEVISDNVIYFPVLLRLTPAILDIVNNYNKILYSSENIDTFIRINDDVDNSFGLQKYAHSFDNEIEKDWQIKISGFNCQNRVKEVTLRLTHGDFIQLKGPSGIGKSTLIESIFLIGEQSTEYSVEILVRPDCLPPSSFYSPQTTQVFNGTIKDNIVLDAPSDYFSEFLEEIKKINDPFIFKNLDTQITAGSTKLSGGEIQRIGILRALYSRADILILDEPFSALDEVTAQKYEVLIRRMCNAVLIVSHTKLFEQYQITKMEYE